MAKERRHEFLQSLSVHRVSTVFFLSTLRDPAYDDNWDEGIRNWNKPALRKALIATVKDFRPDLTVTLNPEETWAHPQHVGLGRLVAKWRSAGRFDQPQRPALYGLREHAWYPESMPRQPGDLTFFRATHSNVLGSTYERYWRKATSAYISQSSHPVWLDARAAVGILPGYRGIDVLRRIDRTKGKGFDNAAGVLIGRTGAQKVENLDQRAALLDALGDLDIPVLYDVDVGHLPPQLLLVNGASSRVRFGPTVKSVRQTLA